VRSTVAAGQAASAELGVGNIAPQRARKREYFPQCWPASPTQQNHTIVQRDCISSKRTDMIVGIRVCAPVEACQLKRQ
jgi:hypothetical protein